MRPLSSQSVLDLEYFEQLLASGGDERIAIDPRTGRNRYGTPRAKACEEVWLSSSTATAVSPRGYDAAIQACESVLQARASSAIPDWFDRVRARLTDLFAARGSEIILSSSGTELELIALFLAKNIFGRPLTNVVVAPGETGRGVLQAASGRHFLGSTPLAGKVAPGSFLAGFDEPETLTVKIEIRDQCGKPLPKDAVDDRIVREVERIVADDRCALIHLLDCSKTNLSGLQRATAAALMEKYAGKVLVVVDSCQLRCSAEHIRADLRAGFMVMVAGSKFAAGPPFAGAILLPRNLVEDIRVLHMLPGLLAYTAAEDWPASLRGKIDSPFVVNENIGTGLRWEAALAELERLFALPAMFRETVARAFAGAVERSVQGSPCLRLIEHDCAADRLSPCRTIFPVLTDVDGVSAGKIHRGLRRPLRSNGHIGISDRVFHVGQPVPIGSRSALRVCLSASHIVDVAESMKRQRAFDAAMRPLLADIDELFLKWQCVARELCRHSQPSLS